MMGGEQNQSRMESGGHDFFDTVEVSYKYVRKIWVYNKFSGKNIT